MARPTEPHVKPTADRWGRFGDLCEDLSPDGFAVVDRRVAKLHPTIEAHLRARLGPAAVMRLDGGEETKRFAVIEEVLRRAQHVSRDGAFVAVGGGALGDVATVIAHLLKRGVNLIQVPTTLLAAVDSSIGGKGAINIGAVKNAAGVFHAPAETWLCGELLDTLPPAQLRDGHVEAWKMAACLDADLWNRWRKRAPGRVELIRESRRLKRAVCARDPLERTGRRVVLNFGHTFGHVLESLSDFRLSHGAAVRLGVLCALDAGRAVGVTPERVAREVEASFASLALNGERGPREALARGLAGSARASLDRLLLADKKTGADGELRLVLLERLGRARLLAVPPAVWAPLLRSWRRGERP